MKNRLMYLQAEAALKRKRRLAAMHRLGDAYDSDKFDREFNKYVNPNVLFDESEDEWSLMLLYDAHVCARTKLLRIAHHAAVRSSSAAA